MKGYLIFVEGSNTPTHVHVGAREALVEAHRLALKFPDKEVMLLHLTKRLKAVDNKVMSIGSHLPETAILTTQDMVRHDSPNCLLRKEQKQPAAPAKKPFVVVKKRPLPSTPSSIF